MKTKREYFYLDDFEHRLPVGCLMTARNECIHEGRPIEDVNELILKIIDAPSKKLRVIVKENAKMEKYITDERTGLKYELVGNYYIITGDNEPKQYPIGIWGNGIYGISGSTARHSIPDSSSKRSSTIILPI